MRLDAGPRDDYAGDTGAADPALRAVLAAAGDGQDAYLAAVAALCSARLLLPILPLAATDERLAGLDRIEPEHPEREEPGEVVTELVAVTLAASDGSRALPAFTGADALAAWGQPARPVPCRLDEVAVTALAEGADVIVVDVAGPTPLIIESGLVAAFAERRRLVRLPDGGWGWLFAAPDSPSRPAAG